MKYLLCEVMSVFCGERDRSFSRVSNPLQIFETEEAAEYAWELFNPFYNFSLRVVAEDQLDEEFR